MRTKRKVMVGQPKNSVFNNKQVVFNEYPQKTTK